MKRALLLLAVILLIPPILSPPARNREGGNATRWKSSDAFSERFAFLWSSRVVRAAEPANGADEKESEKRVSLDLGEATLEEFVIFVRDVLNLQLEYDKNIFIAQKHQHYFGFLPQKKDELYGLLKETLDLYGFDIITTGENGNLVYHVIKKDDIAKITPVPLTDEVDDNKVAFVTVRLEHADATYIADQVAKITGASKLVVLTMPETNSVAIRATPPTIKYIKDLIEVMDIKEAAPVTEVVHLQFVESKRMVEIVNTHLDITQTGERKDSRAARKTYVKLTPVEKPNAVIITAPKREVNSITEFIKKFDVEIKYAEREVVTREYRLEHVNPQEIADIISDIFQVPGPFLVGVREGESAEVTPNTPSTTEKKAEGTTPTTALDEKMLLPFGIEDYEKPTVLLQKGRSAIIITTSNRVHEKIAELVKMLDKRVPQVFIQAALVSIAYDADLNIVTELSTVGKTVSGSRGFAATDFGLSSLSPVPGYILSGRADFRSGALTFGISHGNANIIPILVNISKTDSRVNVVSMPSVLADNDQKSEFSTQDSAPILTRSTQSDESVSETFGGYETASIKIGITPTILKGERLRLDVNLLMEAFSGPQASPEVPPPKISNTFSGVITVPDQKTIVVGGLVTENESTTVTKVPILGDIPILGILFRNTTALKGKSVLYVFITPRILRSQDTRDEEGLAKEKQEEIDTAKKDAEKIKALPLPTKD